MQLRAMAMARCVLPVPVGTVPSPSRIVRCTSPPNATRRPSEATVLACQRMKGVVDRLFARQNPGAMLADMRPAAGGCEIRTAPRLCLARLRDLRAYLDAVLGSNDGDSPLTDGADHASEPPTARSVRRAAAPTTDPERTPPGDGGECESAPDGSAFMRGLMLGPEGGAP